MDILIIVAQFILSLSILIVLHEFGHFLPAKLFKTKVEKFYLFFDPWFSLFKVKKGETEYGIGWLPLGGYVKIAGMIDESMDKEQLQKEPEPWEFRSKPTWQRLIIMLGGVIVNFLLGFLIFGLIAFAYGDEYLPNDQVKYGIMVDSVGESIGLQNGDHILKVGDRSLDIFNPGIVKEELILNGAKTITVRRDGVEQDISVPNETIKFLASYEARGIDLFATRFPAVIEDVVKDYPAKEAGLVAGDSLIGVNGQSYQFVDQYLDVFEEAAGQEIALQYVRNGNTAVANLSLNDEGKIGAMFATPERFFEFETKKYDFFTALGLGFKKGYDFLAKQIKAFGQMFSSEGNISASDGLGGFISIGSLFPSTWDWKIFWNITAVLSLILGFMNLLPIPALDGGHVMFLLYEMITGRKPSDKFLEYATIAGMILLFGLLIFANGMDILRLFK